MVKRRSIWADKTLVIGSVCIDMQVSVFDYQKCKFSQYSIVRSAKLVLGWLVL